MSIAQQIDFSILGDERGSLIALENHKQIPFEVKRIYYRTYAKTTEGERNCSRK